MVGCVSKAAMNSPTSPDNEMSPGESAPQNETTPGETAPGDAAPSRRQFLQGAGALGGALVLGLLTDAKAQDQTAPAVAPQLVLTLADNPELGKAGGWKIVDLGAQRVIVANTTEGVVACSAICPHKGCEVEYRDADKQFVCPCHKSRFDLTGKVLQGPARTGLAPYDAQNAYIVSAKKTP